MYFGGEERAHKKLEALSSAILQEFPVGLFWSLEIIFLKNLMNKNLYILLDRVNAQQMHWWDSRSHPLIWMSLRHWQIVLRGMITNLQLQTTN